ncbi:hypothetical protein ID866_12061 [Astraeus odoratus]|nr:hypothetical protein ID866_12061 [Astraeus odoratus]
MSSPRRTLSPHVRCLAKTKAPGERMEEEWRLVSEGELDPVSSDDEKMAEMQDQEKKRRVEVWKEEHRRRQDEAEKRAREEAERLAREEAARKVQKEAERKVQEEHRAQEEAARAREEAERLAKEAAEREEAAKRVAEAAEERADTERRAIEERLWEVAGQRSETVVAPPWVAKPSRRMTVVGPSAPGQRTSGVQDPCTRCHNKGTSCILGVAKGKTSACEACRHAKVSCSWAKKMAGETHKRKRVQRSEETEGRDVVDMDADDDEDEERSHFAVLTHLTEEHRDALGALMTTLDMLSTDLLEFRRDSWNLGVATLRAIETIADELRRANNLKEEEMGRSKGKGKEKEEGTRRGRTEDEDRDTEMGGAGPSSLV